MTVARNAISQRCSSSRLHEVAARRAQDHDVDRGDRREHRGVDEQTLEDDLDVHQAVADDGRGKRERDERRAESPSSSIDSDGVTPSANGSA